MRGKRTYPHKKWCKDGPYSWCVRALHSLRDMGEEDVPMTSQHGLASRVREEPLVPPLYLQKGSEMLQATEPRSLSFMWSHRGRKGSRFGLELAHHGVYEVARWRCSQVAKAGSFLRGCVCVLCNEGRTSGVVCGC